MSQDLILKPTGEGAIAWSVVDRRAGTRLHEGRLASGDSLPDGVADAVDRTLVLLPGEHLHVTRLAIPAKSEHQARQAAPFLLEDELASRLAETTILPGPRSDDGHRWVVAVATDLLEGWREALAPIIVRPAFIVPDSLVAAEAGAALTLYDRGDAILFAHDPDAEEPASPLAGVMDTALFGSVVQALVKAAGSGEIAVSRSLGLTGANFRAIGQGGIDLRASAMAAGRLEALPRLFGDSFASAMDWSALVRPLRRPFLMAAGLLLAFCLLIGGETIYYRVQSERFETATLAEFNHAMPEVGRAVIPAEAERLLRARVERLSGDGQSAFLQLVSALDELTDGNDRIRIDHLRFDPARSALSVGATWSDFSDFDDLNARAEQLGLRLEDGGARESSAGIEGEFVMRLP
ncbi:type II secretion system protein GspL [Maricaulis sp.]|uniref:type II secretion system protein GspL n=1 Tax=Maricaulis sp. TaxID=1486257 RepID=UPI003A8D17AE